MANTKNPWDFEKKDTNDKKNPEDILEKDNNQNKKTSQKGDNINLNLDFNYLKKFKSFYSLILTTLLFIWICTGFYKVGADENAVVMYFGKFYAVTLPGLNYAIPSPIGHVEKVSVSRINKEEFGFSADNNEKNRNFNSESLMLTGDENIADIDFEVQWKVGNIKDFLFNVVNPKRTIRNATESTMREIIAKRPIDDVLANKKSEIEYEARELLQKTLDSYNLGIDIVLVQLLRVDPPSQVINAFRDVQTAKADKERKINEAESYTNDVMPKARGEAARIIEEAEAYKQSTIANAQGESERFMSVYNEYVKSRDVTKKRMYIETLEKIMLNTDKIIIDDSTQKNILPYLPLNSNK